MGRLTALAVGFILTALFTSIPASTGFQQTASAQGPTGDAHFNAGIDIFGDPGFENRASTFVRGGTAYFSGWSNAYTDGGSGLITTPHSRFTIEIIGPENTPVFHQSFTADDQGNIQFTVQIAEDFGFGIYDVRYTVENNGYKTISPYSPEPDVSYHPVRFFVTWTEDDIIDVSDRYALEITPTSFTNGSGLGGSPIKFGSYLRFNATLCPSPVDIIDERGFLEPASGEIWFDDRGPAMVVKAELSPLDESQARAAHTVTGFLGEDTCSSPFEFQTGVLSASGRWSVTAMAQWLQKDDSQHVFQVVSDTMTFDVAETLYRSADVTPVGVDAGRYRNTVPLDWSPDSNSILFSHEGAPGEGQKLAILDLTSNEVTELDISSADYIDIMGYPSPYTTKFSPTGDSIVLLLGRDLYVYNLGEKEPVGLTNSDSIGSFDVAFDGRLLYNSNGTLIMADKEAKNQEIILEPGEHDINMGDISPDGKKILYRKYLEGGYGWQNAVLAYYDIEERKEHVIPNIQNGCGSPPRWAPNGFHVIFHESSCSRGWPGGILSVTDINGSFQEYLVPGSNDNPAYFIPSPDGSSILIGFSTYGTGGAVDQLGGPANFYIMTLATPMPEFTSYAVAIIVAVSLAGTIVMIMRFGVRKQL